MTYFIDTNVAIAFSVFPDKFHDSANDFILNTSDEMYWSRNNLIEYNFVFRDLIDAVDDFFDLIIENLIMDEKVFLNKESFENYVFNKTKSIGLDDYKKIKFIDIFWEKVILGYIFEKEKFFEIFKEYALEVPNIFENNKHIIKHKIKLYDISEFNFKKYCNLFNSLEKCGIHKSDNKILLDAHDFGKNRFTIFVTYDEKMLNAINGCTELNINEYKLLN